MEIFKKIIILSLFFAFTVALMGLFFLQKTREDVQLREKSIYWAKKMKNFVYYEATKHNPDGDLLPDQIDDVIISETKNILK